MSTATALHGTHPRQREQRGASSTRQPNGAPPVARGRHRRDPRRTAQQAVLSTRARVGEGDSGRFIRDALADIQAYMQEQHIDPVGPPFARCKSTGADTLDVEVGWPLDRAVEGSGRIHGGSLPTTLIRRPGAWRD
jgi:hypothetical protein